MAGLTLTSSGDRSKRSGTGGSRDENTRNASNIVTKSSYSGNVSEEAIRRAAEEAARLQGQMSGYQSQMDSLRNQINSYQNEYDKLERKRGYEDVEDKYYYDLDGNRLTDDEAYYNKMYQENEGFYNEFMDPENTSSGKRYQAMMDALEAQIAAAQAKYQAQIDSAVRELEYQKTGIADQFGTGAQQAYINKMLAQRDLPQQLASTGITGGLTESSMIGLENDYMNNYNDLLKEKNRSTNEVDLNIANVRANGAAAMQEAAANYQAQMAQLAYQFELQQQQMRQQWAMQQAQLEQQRELAMMEYMGKYGNLTGGRNTTQNIYYNPYSQTQEEPESSTSMAGGNVVGMASANLGAGLTGKKFPGFGREEPFNKFEESPFLNRSPWF